MGSLGGVVRCTGVGSLLGRPLADITAISQVGHSTCRYQAPQPSWSITSRLSLLQLIYIVVSTSPRMAHLSREQGEIIEKKKAMRWVGVGGREKIVSISLLYNFNNCYTFNG